MKWANLALIVGVWITVLGMAHYLASLIWAAAVVAAGGIMGGEMFAPPIVEIMVGLAITAAGYCAGQYIGGTGR